MTGSDITTMPLAGTELYRPPGVHKTSPLLDYYAFGVVIREMLTGLGPEGKCRSKTPLALMDVVNFEDLIQRRIWTLDNVWKDVSSIASQCISSVDDDETSGKLSSASIRTSLKSILIKESVQKWTVLDDNNCEICICNGQLETENLSFRRVSEINHSDCSTKIKICCACMRNSYINPVKCQECDNEIKSIIGDGWGAILIAGFDEDNDFFQNDVNMFAHAISSKVLPSMCVSTVIKIDSATQTTEPVSARIDAAFKAINRHNLHTLVFLYSGHHGKQGFKVGKNVYVSIQHINSNIKTCTHIKKVIVFMDCCQPERIKVNEEQRLIQFNATASTDAAISLLNEGSPFTKLLVQAFTMKASGGKCALRDCECRIDGPFITIDSLSQYIEIHRQNELLRGMEPEKSLIKINWQNECLAYNYAYKVAFRFDIVLPTPFTSKHTYEVLSTTVNDYGALIQTILFPKFADLLGEQLNVQQKSISHADKNADCLCIVYDTGPKCFEEVDNIEKLLLAWNSKRLLCCMLRFSLPSNCHKPSGFFLKNGKPVKECMHEKKEFELTEMESLIKELNATKNACDTDTEQALRVFISNMSAFIHGFKPNKRKHQRIKIRFIDLFEEFTSCVVHLLLVDPGRTRTDSRGRQPEGCGPSDCPSCSAAPTARDQAPDPLCPSAPWPCTKHESTPTHSGATTINTTQLLPWRTTSAWHAPVSMAQMSMSRGPRLPGPPQPMGGPPPGMLPRGMPDPRLPPPGDRPGMPNTPDGTTFEPPPTGMETSSTSVSSQPRPINLQLLVSMDQTKTLDDDEEPFLTGLDFMPDERLVAVDNKNQKCIILNERLQRLGTPYKFTGSPCGVVCVPHGEVYVAFSTAVYILSVSSDNTIRLTGVISERASLGYYSICCMSPSDMVVSTYNDPRPAKIISVDGVESDFDHVVFPKKTYKFDESMCTYVQSKNTLVLTDRFASTVFLYDTVKGTSRAVTDGNMKEPRGACVGPGDTVLVCSQNTDTIVHLTSDGALLATYPVDMEYPNNICVSKDGTRLAVSGGAIGAMKLHLYKISPTM